MNNYRIIKKYFTLTRPDKWHLIYLIGMTLLADVPYMFTSLLFSFAVKFITTRQLKYTVLTFILYFALKIISKAARIASYHAQKLYYNSCYRKLQDGLTDKMCRLDYDYYSNEKKSELINTANSDIKELADFGTWLSQALLLFISFLVSIIILWRISFTLMIFGCCINGIVIYILNHYNDLYENIMSQARKKTDMEIGFFSQIMNGMAEIQIFNLMSPFKKMYQRRNEEYISEHNRMINNNIIKNIISPTITMLAEIALMFYSVYHCFRGDFGIETILIIQSYFGNLFSSLSELVSVLGELRLKKVSIDRYARIFHEPSRSDRAVKSACPHSPGAVYLNHISFSYASEPVFQDFSLHAEPGKITGIVGESGSGKSTIFKLILGLIRPDTGSVRIDQYDPYTLSPSSLSGLVTMVNQDPFIFHMSIYENLAFINPDRQAIEDACKKVHLYDYIMSLPDKFDTVLSENASDLSGGQKQRLAIARALLKNSRIILLDEITSALDEMLSENILSFLNEIKKDHTILMITHRSKEYQLCDEIIRLDTLS